MIIEQQKAVLNKEILKKKRNLGSPIGIGGAKREFFGAWYFLGPPIDSCR